MIGWIKYLWGWEWGVNVCLYAYVWRTFALSTYSLTREVKVFVVELAYNSMMLQASPIVIVDGFYL